MNDLVNKEVIAWTKATRTAWQAEQNRLGINHASGSLFAQSKYGFGPRKGLIERIGFNVTKHGVFTEKGVGKGRNIGSAKQTPKPHFNPIVESRLPLLADVVAGTHLINAQNILIR